MKGSGIWRGRTFTVKKVNNKVSTLLAMLSVFSLSSCGKIQQKEKFKNQNPFQREIGHIVKVKPSENSKVKENFIGSVRVIDAESGLFEVLSPYSKEDILEVAPEAEVSNNIFFAPKHPMPENFAPVQLGDRQEVNSNSFKPCLRASEAPISEISVLNGSEMKGKAGSVNRGQIIKLSAHGSQSHPRHPSKLVFAWKVIFPNEIEPQGPFSFDANFDLQLSELGIYSIGLIAQDFRGACAISVIRVGVTDNPKFAPPSNEKPLLPLAKLDGDFSHLKIVGADKAWNLTQGKGQTIAIIDSGVDYNHPYLSGNLAINNGEIPDNGVDDDGNGFIDDLVGWDFAQDDALPYDDEGHGSHVAGIAAGKVFGVAQEAKILAIKGLAIDGSADMGLIISSILYATKQGATVINLSVGGPMGDVTSDDLIPLKNAFDVAMSKGVVIVTASGNGTQLADGSTIPVDIDRDPFLPAGLNFLNNISVAATNVLGQLASYSNYGFRSVKIAAPGGDTGRPIFSAKQDNTKGQLFVGQSGTSMAAPVVAGSIALARAANPKLTLLKLNELLLTSGNQEAGLRGKVRSERVLDTFSLVSRALGTQF